MMAGMATDETWNERLEDERRAVRSLLASYLADRDAGTTNGPPPGPWQDAWLSVYGASPLSVKLDAAQLQRDLDAAIPVTGAITKAVSEAASELFTLKSVASAGLILDLLDRLSEATGRSPQELLAEM
jgi:hypothetical protein